ncbi:MAG TPA: tetratricopeptide repeat protein [Polyangiales bacterium]|nr:tetratricopeptide repeat protein [Polyangiales bacterium]
MRALQTSKAFAAVLSLSCAAALAACGGGGSAGGAESSTGSSGPAATEGGQQVKTGGGQAVSVKAHNEWTEGLKLFKSYEAKGGWNDGRCDEVAGHFTTAASAQKKFAEALYMAGLANDRCGRKDKAQDFYRQSVGANSKFCKARVAIALEAQRQGGSVESEFARAVQDDPQCTEGYVNLAIMQRKRGIEGNKEALSNLRRALAIDAQYLPAFNEMALLYLSEAADNTKKLDLAEVVCSQAQKINAAYAPIYNTWGLIDLRRNKIIDASAKFQKATELDPKIFEAHMNFARITIGFRGYQDAKAAYEQALSLQPNDFEAQLGLGVALRGLQENTKAQEAYEKASKMAPNRPEPYYNLGILYQDFMNGTADEMKKARGYYQEFLSKAGSDKKFAPQVEEIQRKCKQEGKRKNQGKNACIAGRIQNIQLYLDTMKQMAEMEKLQKEQEKQMKAMEEQEKQQQQAAPPADAAPAPAPDKK